MPHEFEAVDAALPHGRRIAQLELRLRASSADTPCDDGTILLLNSRDIAALNRARAVLRRLEDAAWRSSLEHYDPYAAVSAWDLGRLSNAASAAEDAIFHVLSTARINCHLRITDDQLHGSTRTEPSAAQASDTARTTDAHPNGARTPEKPESTDSSRPSTEAGSDSAGGPAARRRRSARTSAKK